MSRNLGSNVSDFWQYFEQLLGIAMRDPPAFTRTIGKGQGLTLRHFPEKNERKWKKKRKRKEGKKEEREGNARNPYL